MSLRSVLLLSVNGSYELYDGGEVRDVPSESLLWTGSGRRQKASLRLISLEGYVEDYR